MYRASPLTSVKYARLSLGWLSRNSTSTRRQRTFVTRSVCKSMVVRNRPLALAARFRR
ncbi:hypothetical protein O9929_02555 [Vibrio lentus]|nr:hypothetical protein [Vibrio lentus]